MAPRDIGPHGGPDPAAYADRAGTPSGGAIVEKVILRVAGALALLIGVAIIVVAGLALSRLPSGVNSDVSADAVNSIAIGALGALLGVGLIIYSGRAPKPGA